MNEQTARLKKLLGPASAWLNKARRYSLPIFVGVVLLIYGVLLLQIHRLTTIQPTPDQITSQVKATHTPRIDPAVVRQLQSLQDNSVNVQALFNQARNNPFQ